MRSTSMVIDPQSKDCWLLAGDGDEGTRAAIYAVRPWLTALI